MNIVVCVKYVPDATADRHFEDDNTVDRVGVDGLLSELDEYAVEQALQVKEKLGDDSEVTVLTVGPEQATDAIRKALQMGADKGVHVVDDAIAGSDALGHLAGPGRGDQEDRARPGHLWDGLDRRLDGCGPGDAGRAPRRPGRHPRLRDLCVPTGATTVTIRRDGDAATETIEGTLPLVLSVTDQSGEARYPSFKGIMAAKKKPLETWSLSDLGVDAELVGLSAAWSVVEGTEARPPRTAGEVVTDEDGSGATALVEFLASKKFI